jgi:hypothetical protein
VHIELLCVCYSMFMYLHKIYFTCLFVVSCSWSKQIFRLVWLHENSVTIVVRLQKLWSVCSRLWNGTRFNFVIQCLANALNSIIVIVRNVRICSGLAGKLFHWCTILLQQNLWRTSMPLRCPNNFWQWPRVADTRANLNMLSHSIKRESWNFIYGWVRGCPSYYLSSFLVQS